MFHWDWSYLFDLLLSVQWYDQWSLVSALVVLVVCVCAPALYSVLSLLKTSWHNDECLSKRAEITDFAAWPWGQEVTNDISTNFIQEKPIVLSFEGFLKKLNSTFLNLLSVLGTLDFIKYFNLINRSHLSLMAIWIPAIHGFNVESLCPTL